MWKGRANGAADQRWGGREYFRDNHCTLHSLDGRREAPNRRWMYIRGADGEARIPASAPSYW